MSSIRPLPFVIGIIGDFAAQAARSAALWDRKFISIDKNNFKAWMAELRPAVRMVVPNELTGLGMFGVDLTFQCLEDFSPYAVIERVDVLKALAEARREVAAACNRLRAIPTLGRLSDRMDLVGHLVDRYSETESRISARQPALSSLLLQRRYAREDIPDDDVLEIHCPQPASDSPALATALEWVRGVKGRAAQISSLESCLTELDLKISKQLHPILHNNRLQQVESSWRALHRLVNSITGTIVHVLILDIESHELRHLPDELLHSQSRRLLWSLPFTKEMDCWGGQPFVLLMSSTLVGPDDTDMRVLDSLAGAAAKSRALVVAGAAPELFDVEDFTQLDRVIDIKAKLNRPEIDSFKRFRKSPNARHTVIVLPSYIGRAPYQGGLPGELTYNESLDRNADLLWCNPAFALAECLARAFERHPFCGERIRGPGSAGELKDLSALCNADIANAARFSDSQCIQLAELGFAPLRLALRQSAAAFTVLRTVSDFVDEDLNEKLPVPLEHRIVLARLFHHVAHELRSRYGKFGSIECAEKILNQLFLEEIDRYRRQSPLCLLKDVRIELRQEGSDSVTLSVRAEMMPVTMFGAPATLHECRQIHLPH